MVYGQDYNRSEFAGFGDVQKVDIPRGTRVQWSGLVPEDYLLGYLQNSDIKSRLARRGLPVEDLSTTQANFDVWNMIQVYRVFITVTTPFDWNTYDLANVISDEVKLASDGIAPKDVNLTVLLQPYGIDRNGQPIYNKAPNNTPGGDGNPEPDFSLKQWLQDLADSFNVSVNTLEIVGIAAIAALVILPNIGGGRRRR